MAMQHGFCPRCGAALVIADQAFCNSCGSEIPHAASPEPSAVTPTIPAAPSAETTPPAPLPLGQPRPPSDETPPGPAAIRQTRRSRRWFGLAVIGALMVVVVAVVGAYALLLQSGSPQASPSLASGMVLTSPPPNPLAGIVDPGAPAFAGSSLTPDATKVLTVTALRLSLERYRGATGSYPATLAALFPTYAPLGPDGKLMTAPPVGSDYTYQATTSSGYTLSVVLSNGQRYGTIGTVSGLHIRRHSRIGALLAVCLLASGQLGTVPAARAADGVVAVDNTYGNVIATGEVIRSDPSDALVTVTNGFHFWAAVDVLASTGNATLRAAKDNIGGFYAAGGLIGPNATAAWDGTFDLGAQAHVRIHYDLSSAGGAAALAANLLTIISDSLGVSLSAASPSKLETALKLITDLPDFVDLVAKAQNQDLWGFVTSFKLLLDSKSGRDTIRQAFTDLQMVVTDKDLLAIASVVSLFDWCYTLFDSYRAALTGEADGTVTFWAHAQTGSATPTATATPAPTKAVIPTSQSPAIYTIPALAQTGVVTVNLPAGVTVRVTASGPWCMGGSGATAECGSPAGIRWAHTDEPDVVLPSAMIGTLIGRLGTGPLFAIGTDATFSSGSGGTLILLFNDRACCYSDNSGSIRATISGG